MKMKTCCLLLLVLGATGLAAESDPVADPLISPPIVLCLRPLRLADQPGLSDAVETVRRLNSFSQTQKGYAKRAVDALVTIFQDLFRKEQELAAAELLCAQVEQKALAKEQLADRTETVGSPLTGPNPRLAVMFRQEAAQIRGAATRKRDELLKSMKHKIAAYNQSLSYFQSQGDTEVVIALANSLFAIVDRRLPGFEFTSVVTREWVEQQKRGV